MPSVLISPCHPNFLCVARGQCLISKSLTSWQLGSDGLVDISQFLVLGQNTLRFTQSRDMSDYWLVLCGHHPTSDQLNAVARRRYKERTWAGWLQKLSRPVQLLF